MKDLEIIAQQLQGNRQYKPNCKVCTQAREGRTKRPEGLGLS